MVINEFGELGVDNDLVVDTDEEVFEMNNGCICCTVRGDLIRIVGGLMKRRDRFDGIIIETTGLANPAPVAQTFFVDETVRAKTRLDAIVTVVDAKHLPQRLARQPRGGRPDRLRRRHRAEQDRPRHARGAGGGGGADPPDQPLRQNPPRRSAPTCRSPSCSTRAPSTSTACSPRTPTSSTTTSHEHNEDVALDELRGRDARSTPSASTPGSAPCWPSAGSDLLRTKGILAYAGEDRRFAFQAVHMIADGDFIGPWKEGEPRTSRIVFIGRNLNRPQLRRGFESCQAA